MISSQIIFLCRALSAGVAALISFAAVDQLQANVINAKSVALADVSTAIAAAREGDAVIVPAGSATWTATLTISKHITLQGAGVGQTIITDGAGSSTLLVVNASNGSQDAPTLRVTGFEFKGNRTGPSPRCQFIGSSIASQNPLVLGCSSRFRLDNCKFDQLTSEIAQFKNLLGVVDHCVFITRGPNIQVMHTNWTPPGQTSVAGYAHGSWADDPYWGSNKFLFVEDCDFTNDGGGVPAYGINPYEGARLTIRYNTFHDYTSWDAHGSEGRQPRGTKQIDAYKNKILFNRQAHVGQIRSGTWLVHDNTFTNCKNLSAQIYRLFRNQSWGPANGQNKWDNNPDTAPVASGIVASKSGDTITASGSPGWTAQEFDGKDGFTYVVRNMEIAVTANGPRTQSYLADNGSNTLLINSTAESPVWAAGDRFEVWRVRSIIDGPGWGKGRLMTGGIKDGPYTVGDVRWADNGALASWPQKGYPNEPCYVWNNVNTGSGPAQVGFGPEGGMFLLGRDFFNLGNVGSIPVQIGPVGAKYDYKPFVYPHPLVSGDPSPPSPPDPPTNLQAVPGS
ncbi:hypothetical protein BH18ACI4_BH18ACI4_09810 [soil metagenome]